MRTAMPSVSKPFWPGFSCSHAAMRSPEGVMPAIGSSAWRSGGDSDGPVTQPAAPAEAGAAAVTASTASAIEVRRSSDMPPTVRSPRRPDNRVTTLNFGFYMAAATSRATRSPDRIAPSM
jgi:hypothetical protein